MRLLGRVSVFPVLPARIKGLRELARNLWWVWNPEAQDLFVRLDENLWRQVYQNPERLLLEIDQKRLDTAANDPLFQASYDATMEKYEAYRNDQKTWFKQNHPNYVGKTVAYFSAEFGLHESLPIYSGGLGILSGDHCKSSSNLDIPFVGVGLLYNQGYFRQQLRPDGMQEALYDKLNFSELSLQPAQNADGGEVVIHVELPGRLVFAKVWQVSVGRIPVYLLDTDIDRNTPEDRRFSAQLYGGDHDMRIAQEIILGIGGVRALRALGITPSAWHMNEGHSAFLGLERIRELVQQQGLGFQEALEAVAADAVFTTHTPVPAGNDAFSFQLMEKYFGRFYPQLGIGREEFLALARQDVLGGPPLFSLSVLALRLSRQANGVSALHGVVSRKMWSDLWPGVPAEEVPITSITNGVHTETWIAPEWRPVFSDAVGEDWRDALATQSRWEAIRDVPNETIWATRRQLKQKMVIFLRQRLRAQRLRAGESYARVLETDTLLDPEALTIGFARRFATYKRATLIFRDIARLAKSLNDPSRPVQIVFAGKAHPADMPGKEFIQRVVQFARDENFSARVFFIEDYDMNVARHLVHGCDVWLNNPRRPLEASGTSGQKAAANGCLNFSILDGWWCEGYNGVNGWSIGEEREFANTDEQDESDALSFYHTLEQEIVPLYYERDKAGIPNGWVARVKDAIATLTPEYSTHRMVSDYVEKLYLPAIDNGERVRSNNFAAAKQFSEWKSAVGFHWHRVFVEVEPLDLERAHVGDPIEVTAHVKTGGISPEHLQVEIYQARERAGQLSDVRVVPMDPIQTINEGTTRYQGTLTYERSGAYVYGVRVLPRHPGMLNRHELALIHWA